MIKKILLLFLGAIFIFSGCADKNVKSASKSISKNFRAISVDKAEILQSGKNKLQCSKCGMHLPMFYKTNHAAKEDGVNHQYCSINCLAVAMKDSTIVSNIKVVDTNSLKFITAVNAFYVVGSSKPATMARVSKYAFSTNFDAKSFSSKFGGKIMSYSKTIDLVKGN